MPLVAPVTAHTVGAAAATMASNASDKCYHKLVSDGSKRYLHYQDCVQTASWRYTAQRKRQKRSKPEHVVTHDYYL